MDKIEIRITQMKIEINTLEYKDTTRCIFIQQDNDVLQTSKW